MEYNILEIYGHYCISRIARVKCHLIRIYVTTLKQAMYHNNICYISLTILFLNLETTKSGNFYYRRYYRPTSFCWPTLCFIGYFAGRIFYTLKQPVSSKSKVTNSIC